MSLLRGYCLFNEMRMHAKIYSASNRDVQLVIRELDKKANFIFSQIPQAEEEEQDKDSKKEKHNNLAPQT